MAHGKRQNWSTKIYNALTWARLKVILKNEREAEERIEDLAERTFDDLVLAMAMGPRLKSARAEGQRWIRRHARGIMRRFAEDSQAVILQEALDAANEIRAATRAAIMGRPLKSAVRAEAAAYIDADADPEDMPQLDPLVWYNDAPIADAGDIVTGEFLGTTLDKWEATLATKSLPDMAAAYSAGIIAGESIEQIARRTRDKFDLAPHSARMMARTAIQSAANRMQDKVYSNNKHLIGTLVFTATLDVRTCPVCGGYDGSEYPPGGSKPGIPVHIACRCTYVPKMKSAAELGLGPLEIPDRATRESMDGNVPNTLKYEDWIKQPHIQKKHEAFQKKQRQKYARRAKARRRRAAANV